MSGGLGESRARYHKEWSDPALARAVRKAVDGLAAEVRLRSGEDEAADGFAFLPEFMADRP